MVRPSRHCVPVWTFPLHFQANSTRKNTWYLRTRGKWGPVISRLENFSVSLVFSVKSLNGDQNFNATVMVGLAPTSWSLENKVSHQLKPGISQYEGKKWGTQSLIRTFWWSLRSRREQKGGLRSRNSNCVFVFRYTVTLHHLLCYIQNEKVW